MSVLSLLINPAVSHTTCGFLITPTAPLNPDNLQQEMSATRASLQKAGKFREIRAILQKCNVLINVIDNTRKNKILIALTFAVDRVNVGYKSPSDNEDL